MKAKGIQNAVALLGGFDGWKQAGLPINAKQ
jgi:rhodanese-related sulfurtransferase